jgi:hypothetical protein
VRFLDCTRKQTVVKRQQLGAVLDGPVPSALNDGTYYRLATYAVRHGSPPHPTCSFCKGKGSNQAAGEKGRIRFGRDFEVQHQLPGIR